MNETLIQAAEHIDQHGWLQGELDDDLGRVCLYGALNAVYRDSLDYVTARDHLREFIEVMRGIRTKIDVETDNVVYLNDTILTSGAEASKVLREAAEWVPNA